MDERELKIIKASSFLFVTPTLLGLFRGRKNVDLSKKTIIFLVSFVNTSNELKDHLDVSNLECVLFR